MKNNYELTLDDYREASNAVTAGNRTQGRPPKTRAWAWWVLGIFSVLCVAVVMYAGWGSLKETDVRPRSVADEIAELAPWLALLALFTCFRYAAIGGSRRGRISLMVLGTITILTGAFVVTFRTEHTLISVIAWWVVLQLYYTYWRVATRNQDFRRAWEGLSHLHRPKSFEVTDRGFCIIDALSRLEYNWPALRAWGETSGLFLLFISESLFHILPKRAFVDETSVSAFRDLLQDVTNRTSAGFPVIIRPSTTATPDSTEPTLGPRES